MVMADQKAKIHILSALIFLLFLFLGTSLACRQAGFVFDSPHELPVLAIEMKPEALLAMHQDRRTRGKKSERAARLEIWDEQGQSGGQVGFGLRLHGGLGRDGEETAKKSYKASFRKKFGAAKLNYALIPGSKIEGFDKLVLRAGSGDRFMDLPQTEYTGQAAYIRDQVMRDLYRQMGGLAPRGAWVLLVLNREFRGLYNVVEYVGKNFLSAYLGGSEWDLVENDEKAALGSLAAWQKLHTWVANNDLRQTENYQQIQRMIDLENFTAYVILNLWAQNLDWPESNFYAVRKKEAQAKWQFICWDAEQSLGLSTQSDAIAWLISRSGQFRKLFVSLAENREYRSYFRKQLDHHLAQALNPNNVLLHIDRQKRLITSVMPKELARNAPQRSVQLWQKNIERMKQFARRRGEQFTKLLNDHFQRDCFGCWNPQVLPRGMIRSPNLSRSESSKLCVRFLAHILPCAADYAELELELRAEVFPAMARLLRQPLQRRQFLQKARSRLKILAGAGKAKRWRHCGQESPFGPQARRAEQKQLESCYLLPDCQAKLACLKPMLRRRFAEFPRQIQGP